MKDARMLLESEKGYHEPAEIESVFDKYIITYEFDAKHYR